jgi:microcystin-dependent protein
MTARTNIRIRTIPKFPAQVLPGNGISVSQSGGVYTIAVTESDSIAAAASADAAAASAAAATTTANAAAASAAAAAASAAAASAAVTAAIAGISDDQIVLKVQVFS